MAASPPSPPPFAANTTTAVATAASSDGIVAGTDGGGGGAAASAFGAATDQADSAIPCGSRLRAGAAAAGHPASKQTVTGVSAPFRAGGHPPAAVPPGTTPLGAAATPPADGAGTPADVAASTATTAAVPEDGTRPRHPMEASSGVPGG